MRSDDITVSVCIPTRNRPEMLLHCVQSALGQTVPPREIVIGDDSDDDRTERLVREIEVPSTIDLVYIRNRPPLGAARNFEKVFLQAKSDWLLLIHDDDWVLPCAIEHLTSPLRDKATADIIYGNQQIAGADGSIDQEVSSTINPAFSRKPELAGRQRSALWAAARQQMPNDGFLVSSRLVRKIGYLSDGVTDCEYAFGVRAALNGAELFFVDKLVSVYRHSAESLARGPSAKSTSAVDMAFTIWRFRRALAEVADAQLREHLRSIVYRATVHCGLWQRRRLEALKWALHPRFGVRWWGKEGLGVVSALLFPRLRQRIKQFARDGSVQRQKSAQVREPAR